MNIEVPEFGESITKAVVVNLIKQSGDYVEKGEDIVELETDKVNSVIPAPASGILSLTIELEQEVSSGQTIGSIDESVAKPAQKEAKPVQEKEAPKPPQSGPSARSTPEQFLNEVKEPKYLPQNQLQKLRGSEKK